MKKRISIALFVLFAVLGLTHRSNFQVTAQQDDKACVPPEIIVLGETAKLGKVTFNHGNHMSKNFNVEGTAPIDCIVCHHVEQPMTEALKLKTVFPADRTTTLTLDSLKEPNAPGVTNCRTCHIPKDGKPTILTEIPQIKVEKSKSILLLTNQNAFHMNCAGCHDQVAKARKNVIAPTTMKCMACHKKS